MNCTIITVTTEAIGTLLVQQFNATYLSIYYAEDFRIMYLQYSFTRIPSESLRPLDYEQSYQKAYKNCKSMHFGDLSTGE